MVEDTAAGIVKRSVAESTKRALTEGRCWETPSRHEAQRTERCICTGDVVRLGSSSRRRAQDWLLQRTRAEALWAQSAPRATWSCPVQERGDEGRWSMW